MEESEDIRSTADADATLESAILQLVLALHPATLTLVELTRELGEAEDAEAVERAIRDLSAAGLLHRGGDLVLPTRAALRFDELLAG